MREYQITPQLYTIDDAAKIMKKSMDEVRELIHKDEIELENNMVTLNDILYTLGPKSLHKISHDYYKSYIEAIKNYMSLRITEITNTSEKLTQLQRQLVEISNEVNSPENKFKRVILKKKLKESEKIAKEMFDLIK